VPDPLSQSNPHPHRTRGVRTVEDQEYADRPSVSSIALCPHLLVRNQAPRLHAGCSAEDILHACARETDACLLRQYSGRSTCMRCRRETLIRDYRQIRSLRSCARGAARHAAAAMARRAPVLCGCAGDRARLVRPEVHPIVDVKSVVHQRRLFGDRLARSGAGGGRRRSVILPWR
jgi:hypothetical protein